MTRSTLVSSFALVMMIVGAGSAGARQIYNCDQLKGKGVEALAEQPRWFDDELGSVTIVIEDDHFYASVKDFVPSELSGLVDGANELDLGVIASADADHVTAIMSKPSAVDVYQLHVPTGTLTLVSSQIDRFPVPGNTVRAARSWVFVSHCIPAN